MNQDCAIFRTVDFIGKRWTLLILLELYKGTSKKQRYSELKKKIPSITPKILSLRLKELADNKLITKNIDASSYPVKSEYQLTERGEDFISIIQGIKKWGLRWNIRNPVCESTNCANCKL